MTIERAGATISLLSTAKIMGTRKISISKAADSNANNPKQLQVVGSQKPKMRLPPKHTGPTSSSKNEIPSITVRLDNKPPAHK